MTSILIDIEGRFNSRMNLANALALATKAVENRNNLEYICSRISKDLTGKDYESATFAFEILNSQCGGNLPTPTFMLANDTTCGFCTSQGQEFEFKENVELATDLLSALPQMEHSITSGMGKLMLVGLQCGTKTEETLRAIGMLYPLKQ